MVILNQRKDFAMNKNRIKLIFEVVAAVIAIFIIIAVTVGLKNGILSSKDAFVDFVKSAGVFAPLVFVVIEIISVVIALLPCSLGYPVSTAAFGFWGGFFLNALSTIAGSAIIFMIVRIFGKPLVEAIVEKKHFDRYGKFMEKTSFFEKLLAAAFFVPFFPDNALCYLAGLTKIETKRFVVLLLLFKPWKMLFYTWASGFFIDKFSHLWAMATEIIDKL